MVQQTILPPPVRDRGVPMSFEEFLAWAPDEGQAEWVDGEGIAYVSTSTRHGELVDFLADLLRRFVMVFALGRVYSSQVLLRLPNRPSGRMPDVFVVGSDALDQIHAQWVDGGVRFVAEFISEESELRDLVEKRDEFEAAGIPEYVAIDARPGGTQFVYLQRNEFGRFAMVEPDTDGRYHSRALPGFWLDPAWFRQETLPDIDEVLLAMAPGAYEAWLLAKIRAHRGNTDPTHDD